MRASLLVTYTVLLVFFYLAALLGLNALVSANAVEGTLVGVGGNGASGTGTEGDTTAIDLGCIVDFAGSAIRCKQTALDHIAQAASVLVPAAPLINASAATLFPKEVDIVRCDVQTLPNLFARFNASLERVRVANSQLQFVAINAFTGLEYRLRVLDLSGNLLRNIPAAVHTLVALETLDLRDNHISTMGDPSREIPFRNTLNLRELLLSANMLGFEEAVGGGSVGGPGLSSLLTKQVHRLAMDQSVFDLGRAAHTLELLDISDNGLFIVPDQLRTNFSRLRTLLLGNNRIADFPADVFGAMPDLQFLTLDSNLIRTLKFTSLPSSLKLFSLQDNPLQCDCGIMWLLDLVRRNSYLTLQLPPCNTPFYLRDITISHLNDERLCNPGRGADTGVHAVYVTDRDLASFHLGLFQAIELSRVKPEVEALLVEWKVTAEFFTAKFNWSLIVRRQDGGIYNFNTTQFTLANYKRPQSAEPNYISQYIDSIQNLSAPYVHIVCLAVVDNSVHYIHLNHCKGATTLKEMNGMSKVDDDHLPISDTTTSSATSPTVESTTPLHNSTKSQLEDLQFTVNGKPFRRSINFTWTVLDPPEVRSQWKESSATATSRRFPSPLALDAMFTRREYLWKITVRPFASSNNSESLIAQPLNDDKIHRHWHVVDGLLPGTAYYVCFHLESQTQPGSDAPSRRWNKNDDPTKKCMEFITEVESQFPVAPVATATVVSTTLTAIIMALVCCCLPRKYFKGERLGAPRVEEEEDDDDDDDDRDTKGVINRGFLRPQHLVSRKLGQMGSVGGEGVRPRGSLGQLPPAVVKMLEQKRRMLEKTNDSSEEINGSDKEKRDSDIMERKENGKVSNGCVVHLKDNIEKLQPIPTKNINNNNNNINSNNKNNNNNNNNNNSTVIYNKLNDSVDYSTEEETSAMHINNSSNPTVTKSKDCNDNQLAKTKSDNSIELSNVVVIEDKQ